MKVLWIEFDNAPTDLGLGAGVTARDLEDACNLLRAQYGTVAVSKVSTVESIEQLEANHVRKNMGSILRRGIWFPNHSGVS